MLKHIVFAALIAVGFSASSQVRWLETVHNFGAFSESDGVATCRIKFVNESTQPVIVNQVHVTCGCTSPTYERRAIEPSDTGWIELAYNPEGRPGRFEKKVYVDLNTTPSRYTLYIKGCVVGTPSTVNERYPVQAGSLRLRSASAPFGEVTKGKSKSLFFEVYNASTDTVVPKWENLPDFVSVGAPSDTVFPGENMAFTFMVASDKIKEYGLTWAEMALVPNTTTLKANRIEVPLMVMVVEDFSSLTPGQRLKAPIINSSETTVNLGELDGSTPKTATFTVKNSGQDPLVIRRVYSADPGVIATVSSTKLKKGKEAVVTVTVDPRQVAGDTVNARVVVISNDPAEPVMPVRVVGIIKNKQ